MNEIEVTTGDVFRREFLGSDRTDGAGWDWIGVCGLLQNPVRNSIHSDEEYKSVWAIGKCTHSQDVWIDLFCRLRLHRITSLSLPIHVTVTLAGSVPSRG